MQTMNAKVTMTSKPRHQLAIDLPKNEEYAPNYVHDGKVPCDKYRHPWKRGKDIAYKVLLSECNAVFEDGVKFAPKETGRISVIEPFDSQNGAANNSLSDAINFELDFDVIPSSNPSSQDLFTPDEFIETYNDADEIFEKENMDQFSDVGDSWKLDTIGNVYTTLHDALKLRPSLSELSSKLETVEVEDPLLLNNDKTLTEESIFRTNLKEKPYTDANIPMLQQKFDSSLFCENFSKMSDEISIQKSALEEVITEEYELPTIESAHEESASILRSLTGHRVHMMVQDELCVKDVVSKHLVKQQYKDVVHIEQLSLDIPMEPAVTFLDINEIIVTEQDKFCESALLDVPVVQHSSWRDPLYEGQLMPKRVKAEIDLIAKRFLDPHEKQKLLHDVWESEKCGIEIQACQLPVPNIKQHQSKRLDTVKQAKDIVGVLSELNIGKADLALSWEIVKSIDRISDPRKQLVQYQITGGDLPNIALTEVEKFDKYSSSEMQELTMTTSVTAFTKAATIEKPPYKDNRVKNKVRPVSTSSDPLEAFMMLRSKSRKVERKFEESTDNVVEKVLLSDNAAGKTPVFSQVPKKQQNDVTGTPNTPRRNSNLDIKKKKKHHSVKIQLTEELHEVLDVLQSESENYIDKLKHCGEVSTSLTFLSLSPDVTRFMIKQREKHMEDNKIDRLTDIPYKLLVILHGLVGAADLAVNCCFESAIGYLNALQEKYNDILGGVLDSVRQNLFKLRANFCQKNILHPKVVSLCKEVETWLRNKRAKSKDCEQKILVLVKHDVPSLMSYLKHTLRLGNMLTPEVLTTTEPESVIRSLDQHNCLITPCRLLSDSFPWAQFCLVVEYEYMEDSQWQQLCERQHIRHIGLYMHHETNTEVAVEDREWKAQYPERQITVIGSSNITNHTELLQLLEGGQNIVLVERDYSQIRGSKCLFFSDIDVDANTGIVLESLKDISDDCTVQAISTKISALCLKYVKCWLILYSNTKSDSYIYQSQVISNIAKLQAHIANTVHHSSLASVKVLICSDFGEIASLVRHICESCMLADRNRPASQWLQRTWLSQEISLEERFLLMLPCLNSFSAQLLIDRLGMKKIFTNSATTLSQLVPEIDENILKSLEKHVNSSTGLQIRDSKFDEKFLKPAMGDYQTESNEDTLVAKTQKRRRMDYPVTKNTVVEFAEDTPTIEQRSHYFQTSASENTLNSSDTFNHEIEQSRKLSCEMEQRSKPSYVIQQRNNENYDIEQRSKQNYDIEQRSKQNYDTEQMYNYNKEQRSKRNYDIEKKQNYDIEQRSKQEYDIEQRQNYDMEQRSKQNYNEQRQNDDKEQRSKKRFDKEQRQNYDNIEQRSKQNYDIDSRSKQCVPGNSYSNRGDLVLRPDSNKRQTKENERKTVRVAADICDVPGTDQIETKTQNSYSGLFQNVISAESSNTYEYNHGLPYVVQQSMQENEWFEKRPVEYPNERNCNRIAPQRSYDNSDSDRLIKDQTRHSKHSSGKRMQESIEDIERQFPSIEEFNRSFSLDPERSVYCPEDDLDVIGVHEPYKDQHDETYPISQPILDKFHFIEDTSDKIALPGNQPQYDYFKEGTLNNDIASMLDPQRNNNHLQVVDTEFQNTNTDFDFTADTYTDKFNFQPKIIESDIDIYSTDEENKNNQPWSNQQTFVNPHIKRLSKKQKLDPTIEGMINASTRPSNHQNHHQNSHQNNYTVSANTSLADDLKETTRKVLENAQQFSRFELNSKRRPLQHMRIGLAQPVMRETKKIPAEPVNTSVNVCAQEQQMMNRSMWTIGNSPPMDLDYQSSDVNNMYDTCRPYQDHQYNNYERSNKAVFTSQTPRKRKLTFGQPIPGRKGQTKLVFQ